MIDPLGDRMKIYEMAEAGRTFLPRLPILCRLDGRAFHTLTRGMDRPFDDRFIDCMVATTKALVAEFHAHVGYTQSDEITLLMNTEGDPLFGGRPQKLTSVLAGYASASFGMLFSAAFPAKRAVPCFDCRAWVVPSRDEAANVFLWREHDAKRNSVQMLAQAHFSHSQLQNQDTRQIMVMLESQGIVWGNLPSRHKRGTYVRREVFTSKFTAVELDSLPPKHEARSNPDLVVTRERLVEMDMPVLDMVPNRVDVLFNGAPIQSAVAIPQLT